MRAFDITDPPSHSSSSDARATLREVAASLRRDRKWILLAFTVPMLLLIIVSFIPKPSFESTSLLLVRFGREYVYNPESADGNAAPMSFDRDLALQAEVEILASRDVIDRALREIGIEKVYPSIAKEMDKSPAKRMDAELLKDSNVVRVTFDHPDPDIAAQVVNHIVAAYFERRRAIFSTPRSAFLEEQVDEYERRLAKVEGELSQFRLEHNVVSFDQQLTLLLDEQHVLELKLADAVQDAGSSTVRVQTLTKSLAGVPADIELSQETAPAEVLDAAKQKLLELRLKESELKSKFFADNPLVTGVQTDIDNAETFIREQESQPRTVVRSGRNQVRDAVESDLIRARTDAGSAATRRAVVQDQLSGVTGRIAELSALQPRVDDLKREQKLVEDGYMAYVRKLEDARVMDERDQKAQANVSIIQSGLRPVTGKSYQPVIIGVGVVLSLCCALLVAFALALMRQTFLLPRDVERSLGLPVLADIPAMR
jgi:uncharacterized protein involved in exopolysaccharide biosynthesis